MATTPSGTAGDSARGGSGGGAGNGSGGSGASGTAGSAAGNTGGGIGGRGGSGVSGASGGAGTSTGGTGGTAGSGLRQRRRRGHDGSRRQRRDGHGRQQRRDRRTGRQRGRRQRRRGREQPWWLGRRRRRDRNRRAAMQPYKGVANSPCAARKKLGVSWYYNWTAVGRSRAATAGRRVRADDLGPHRQRAERAGITSAVASFVSKGGYVLGFNEPDNSGQSNIPVATAISLWPSFDNPAIEVGSPATAANSTPGRPGSPATWAGQRQHRAARRLHRDPLVRLERGLVRRQRVAARELHQVGGGLRRQPPDLDHRVGLPEQQRARRADGA